MTQAQTEMGEVEEAREIAERAVRVAEASGDEIVTARARAHSVMIHLWGNQPGDPAAVEREARAQLPLFEHADDAGGRLHMGRDRRHFLGPVPALQAGTAWRRAIDLFNAAGNRWLAGVYLGWLSSVSVWGPGTDVMQRDPATQVRGLRGRRTHLLHRLAPRLLGPRSSS